MTFPQPEPAPKPETPEPDALQEKQNDAEPDYDPDEEVGAPREPS